MRLDPPADDYGLQDLRRANARSGTVRRAERVSRSPAIHPSIERHQSVPGVERRLYQGPDRRHGGDRRGTERRGRERDTPFDTRSHRERRQRVRRIADRRAAAASGSLPLRRRVDLNA